MADLEDTLLWLAQLINAEATSGQYLDHAVARRLLEEKHGQVWTTDELAREFEVLAFADPLVVVRRRVDKKTGSLIFQHYPRFYFQWQEG